MDTSQSIPDLVLAAQERVSGSADQTAAEAVDLFSMFEARMQHHFKRGPFSRKLKALLLAEGQSDLADRVHQYYLAINVLKHGKGASYRELLASPSALIVVNKVDAVEGAEVPLIDVTMPDFFEGLTQTLLDAHAFLENK